MDAANLPRKDFEARYLFLDEGIERLLTGSETDLKAWRQYLADLRTTAKQHRFKGSVHEVVARLARIHLDQNVVDGLFGTVIADDKARGDFWKQYEEDCPVQDTDW